jgi:anti-sigma regulatory factor (Ser/Thr protein kinase)
MLEIELTRDAASASVARSALREWLSSHLQADELDTATLLTSELVTNAVLHGSGQIALRASLDDDRLLVEVIDEGHGLEQIFRDRELDHIGGWGLKIVDSASSRWGTHEGTTHVWFELERRGPRLGAEKNPAAEPNGE